MTAMSCFYYIYDITEQKRNILRYLLILTYLNKQNNYEVKIIIVKWRGVDINFDFFFKFSV